MSLFCHIHIALKLGTTQCILIWLQHNLFTSKNSCHSYGTLEALVPFEDCLSAREPLPKYDSSPSLSQWQHSDPFDDAEVTHLLVAAAGVQVTVVIRGAAVVDELSFPVVCFRCTVESQADGNLLEFC